MKKPPAGSQVLIRAPLERLELSLPAPEADALSTELQGRVKKFYHNRYKGNQFNLNQRLLFVSPFKEK